jgi:catechol 2,3-dioxygenase-like lactoylglutathione lyase family enzyme
MEFLRVGLQAPRDRLDALRAFYAATLGLPVDEDGSFRIGRTGLAFEGAAGSPFYHVAWLVPGDRFEAARHWIEGRVSLLEGGDIDRVVFDFDNWNALASYFLDAAGNIVELIAHRGFEANGLIGPFEPSELLGVSEVGLVGEQRELAQGLERLGVHLYDGTIGPDGLAFYGERARTFILAPSGRGWLPTGRPAEPHPVAAVISGARRSGRVVGGHRIDVVTPK